MPYALRFFIWFVLCPVFIQAIFASPVTEQASQLWHQRHQGAVNGQANPARVQKIVALYQQAVASDTSSPDLHSDLLRAHFFLTYFTDSTRIDRLKAIRKALADSDLAVQRHPRDAGVLAWSCMLWARYAELAGIVQVARKGAADKIRDLANQSYQLNPTYGQGTALRMLGVVHAEAPYIPMMLTWPSTKKANEYFQKALALNPNNSLTAYMYGDYLARVGRIGEARQYYKKALEVPVETANITEETLFRNRIKARLAEL
jgi:tetratricopeptide (TPR) repeat protein